jgi:hypothetical protein
MRGGADKRQAGGLKQLAAGSRDDALASIDATCPLSFGRSVGILSAPPSGSSERASEMERLSTAAKEFNTLVRSLVQPFDRSARRGGNDTDRARSQAASRQPAHALIDVDPPFLPQRREQMEGVFHGHPSHCLSPHSILVVPISMIGTVEVVRCGQMSKSHKTNLTLVRVIHETTLA